MLIATEDEGSGRRYLKQIAGEEIVRSSCAVTFADHTGSSPKSVVAAAKEAANDSEMPFDEVWLVFDTEGPQNQQRLNEAR